MKKCPTCGQPVEWKDNPTRPFCSERCQLIDFGAWVNEEYAVPTEEALPTPPEEPGQPPSPANERGN